MEKQTVIGRVVLIVVIVGLAVLAYLGKGLALGQDLKGGTTLRFSLDLERAKQERLLLPNEDAGAAVQTTLAVIESRIDRWGLAELNVTAIGDDKFEIALPTEIDADAIVKLVTSLGNLQFRMEVLPDYPPASDGKAPGRTDVWKGSGTFEPTREGFDAFKAKEIEVWRGARERAVPYEPTDKRYRLVRNFEANGYEPHEFHVVEEPELERHRFDGKMLSNPVVAPDNRTGLPAVHFGVKAEFQNDFGEWTGGNVKLPMAILLNDEYRTAPTIIEPLSDNVQVTLGQQDAKAAELEARQLVTVLQTGSIRLQPRQESKRTVGPSLAGEAVRRGVVSTVAALLAVLVFMVVFYRSAGLVADVALVLNLVLLLGAMAFFGATLTLPGIAGIVLTLGMAVDANILIFERIREEQNAGRSVPRAIAEGYERAFTTIVDSNVTTFITALFLYFFGTGSIRGFATSLSLGLLASMFTAIYVTRTFFEIRLLRGNTSPIRMAGTGKPTSIRWMALRSRLIPISLVLVAASVGLFAVLPDEAVYDIDFTGGLKLQARFNRETTVDQVKDALSGAPREVTIVREAHAEDDSGPPTKTVSVGPYEGAQVVDVQIEGGEKGQSVEIRVPSTTGVAGTSDLTERERLDALRAYVKAVVGDRLLSEWLRQGPETYAATGADDPYKPYEGRLRVRLAIEDPSGVLTPALLEDLFTNVMRHYVYGQGNKRENYPASAVKREIKVFAVEGAAAGAERVFDVFWKAEKAGTPAEVDPVRLRQELREFIGGSAFRSALEERLGAAKAGASRVALADPFPVDDLIGRGVAKRQRNDAVVALALSLVGIVLYVAFRFRSYSMGFSAILCLFHDVAIALGAVCVVSLLGVVDAKINLGLVAAFLTIVGFSVNDTVVTFDRIRELRGKSPRVTSKMLDDSVNQTLSRTWRTTATALITVVILFIANWGQRSVLEGLSFTLMVGMIAGVYSTIAIAAPLLLFLPWYWDRIKRYRPRAEAVTWPLRAPGPLVLAAIVVATAVVSLAVKHHTPPFAAFLALIVAPLAVTAGLWLAWGVVFAVAGFFAGYVEFFRWTFRPAGERDADRPRDAA